MAATTGFTSPPRTTTEEGAERRVGIELEFAGVDLKQTADIVANCFGGAVEQLNRFYFRVGGGEQGTFSVELDAELLKRRAYVSLLTELGIEVPDGLLDPLEDIVASVAGTVVPVEVVTPPLPLSALDMVSPLEQKLMEARALGTNASLLHAFGMHLNPECPSLSTDWLLSLLRAFLLLFDWLKREIDVDFTRRLSPFIEPFPPEYIRHVLNPSYVPDFATFADDYLRFNPTRNRALDLLPVLAEVDEARVRSAVGADHKVNKRPALHYRLPNCLIDEPDWSVALEWNRWVEVEKLAHDQERLRSMSMAYLNRHPGGGEEWLEKITKWFDV